MRWPRFLVVLAVTGLIGCRQPLLPAGGSTNSFESHYSPTENLEAIDTALLRGATHSIEMCAYSLTDHALADALKQAAAHGAKVRIYLDRVQTLGELKREQGRDGAEEDGEVEPEVGQAVLRDLAATPGIELRVKHSKTLMHLKSYSVDRVILRSGSANFSPTGEKRQDNDLTLTRDAEAVRRFEHNFDAIWSRTDNEALNDLVR